MKRVSRLLMFYLFFWSLCLSSCKESTSSTASQAVRESSNETASTTDLADAPISDLKDKVSKESSPPPVTPPKELFIKIDEDHIVYQGISFFSTKEKMESKMGKPDSIVEPKYDCGPFSEDWQGVKFFQYFYGNMNFIVSEQKAEIQNILFHAEEKITINSIDLDGTMTLSQVAQKLGIDRDLISTQTNIVLYPKGNADEWYYLEFENDRLVRFDRYEPC